MKSSMAMVGFEGKIHQSEGGFNVKVSSTIIDAVRHRKFLERNPLLQQSSLLFMTLPNSLNFSPPRIRLGVFRGTTLRNKPSFHLKFPSNPRSSHSFHPESIHARLFSAGFGLDIAIKSDRKSYKADPYIPYISVE